MCVGLVPAARPQGRLRVFHFNSSVLKFSILKTKNKSMTMSFQPVQQQERIELLDLLRGFALFGILMVNMQLFNNPHTIMFGDFSIWKDPLSLSSNWFIRFFFEGKFYILFSLLFGMGFQLYLQKADENKSILPLFRKRLMYLLLFGLLHVVFVWFGDILVWYALFGFVMTWLRKKSNRSLIKWSIGLLLIPIVLTTAMLGFMQLSMSIPEAAAEMEASFAENVSRMQSLTAEAYALYPTGSFVELIRFRLIEWMQLLPGLFFFYPNTLAMFLIGMVFIRMGYLSKPGEHRSFFRRLLSFSLPLGLAAAWTMATYSPEVSQASPSWLMLLVAASHTVGGIFMAMTYISLIVLVTQTALFSRITSLVANLGRMALTIYLMQSLIATTLFYSFGFGLYGKVSPFQGILITLAIYTFQLLFSYYWLKKFRFGPMEWLWRSMTYGRAMPMKI
jgi:uncharacterized protein